jgi:Predicted RNA-binding protein
MNLRQSLNLEVGYQRRGAGAAQKLLARVLAIAEKVKAEKRSVELEPMPPKDRRLIHLALASFPGVRTYSVGKGQNRRVVIAPEEASGS